MMRAAVAIALLATLAPRPPGLIDVTVSEGTSMSVAVSPDGRTLAIDLQGSIWTVPASGGDAKAITDPFNDARQPMWSPDGKWITFFAYLDSGYDIWLLDVATGALRQLTKDSADDYMPSWSPDDREIAFASAREGGQGVWAVNVETGAERKVETARGTVDAVSWGPGNAIVPHIASTGRSSLDWRGQSLTGSENVFPFRVSWASPTQFYYVSDGKIRLRGLDEREPQTVDFRATMQVTRPDYVRRKRDFDSTAPRH